jgi:hypothetical protein
VDLLYDFASFRRGVKPHQAPDDERFSPIGEGDADFPFRKGQVKVGMRPARLSTRVHDVKQRTDFSAICASCPALRRVNSSL